MKTVTTTQAKAELHALLDDVAGGEDVTITRHGQVVAILRRPENPPRRFGRFAGRVEIRDDFDEPLDPTDQAFWQ